MSVLAGTLLDRVAQIITRYSMLPPGSRAGVAVSGGADSVVLLHLLHKLSANPMVLHVNHHLRGAESDEDEAFVRSLAEGLGLEIAVQHARPGGGNIEQEARQARREFFLRSMDEYGLCRVALGHTRSDQAETVLFRLLRGSGLTGLAGMRPVTREGLIRPLLSASREEVRVWARDEGLTWREDSSNSNLEFARNRLRHQTIPTLTKEYNSNLEAVLAATASLAQREEDYWNQQIEPIYREITKRTSLGSIFQIGALLLLHPAVQRRVIRRAIEKIRGDLRGIDLSHIEAVLNLCGSEQGHDRVLIPGVDALRSFGQLLLAQPGTLGGQPRRYCLELKPGDRCELPYQAGYLSVNWLKPDNEFCANFKKEPEFEVEVSDLDGSVFGGAETPESLCVRNWQPGDELHRPGHQAAEKIKSLFQEERVLLWERKHWPVVLAGKEVVWARQFGGAARFKVSGESRRIVRLTYRPTLSEGS
ncbi:MAG TPA: tRNA lysidine(34) synthetase TilS [Bryobacteraceae bacterium]|jgi:tRNA(Ile)-lysidine synthase